MILETQVNSAIKICKGRGRDMEDLGRDYGKGCKYVDFASLIKLELIKR